MKQIFLTLMDKFTKNKGKRGRNDDSVHVLNESNSADGKGHSMRKLLFTVTQNLTLNFKHDNGGFIQTDVFEELAEPIVGELVTLVNLGEYYDEYIESYVKTLIFEMMERINNESMWMQVTTCRISSRSSPSQRGQHAQREPRTASQQDAVTSSATIASPRSQGRHDA